MGIYSMIYIFGIHMGYMYHQPCELSDIANGAFTIQCQFLDRDTDDASMDLFLEMQRDAMIFLKSSWSDYPLVNCPIAMERSTIFSWENPLFLWPFSIAFCMFTRGYDLSNGMAYNCWNLRLSIFDKPNHLISLAYELSLFQSSYIFGSSVACNSFN